MMKFLCFWQSEKGVCVHFVSHLWSHVFCLRCAVSRLAAFHIQCSFGTLLQNTHTHCMSRVQNPIKNKNKKNKKHQRVINQDNRMFSWKILGACLCEHCHRWQACFGFCPASPVTQRGHKCGLKCDKTSGAKYWTRNYNWRRNCKNVTAKTGQLSYKALLVHN